MSRIKHGINARRKVLKGSNSISDEIRTVQKDEPNNTFLRGVVLEVIHNPVAFENNAELFNTFLHDVENYKTFEKGIPANSAIIRITSKKHDLKGGKPILFYPFLPSHLSLPIKPGEEVWVTFESGITNAQVGYWMWRVTQPRMSEDLSYTQPDRKHTLSTIDTEDERKHPGFPNGHDRVGFYKLSALQGEEKEAYKFILGSSVTLSNKEIGSLRLEDVSKKSLFTPEKQGKGKYVTVEPVPRFRKRPGDTVLQGSNNTLIVFEEDRPSSQESGHRGGAGTIDIVAGRGRAMVHGGSSSSQQSTFAAINTHSSPTGPLGTGNGLKIGESIGNVGTTVNALGIRELDKLRSPAVKFSSIYTGPAPEENRYEGDPDFVNDASRFYVSMKTDGDKNLSIDGVKDHLNIELPKIDEAAYCILKSDEVRIVARKSGKEKSGNIRIIKEGVTDEDLAYIAIEQDGKIIIRGGNTIHLETNMKSGPNFGPGLSPSLDPSNLQNLDSDLGSGDTDAALLGFGQFPESDRIDNFVGYAEYEKQMSDVINQMQSALMSIQRQLAFAAAGLAAPMAAGPGASGDMLAQLPSLFQKIEELTSIKTSLPDATTGGITYGKK